MKNKKLIIGICVFVFACIAVGIIFITQKLSAPTNASNQINSQQSSSNTDVKQSITQAVSSGKLTQRQADLLIAEVDSQQSFTPGQQPSGQFPTQGEFGTGAQGQFPVSMPTGGQNNFLQRIVDQLNEQDLNTTVDELQAAQTSAQAAGIQIMGEGQGRQFSGNNRGGFPQFPSN